MKKIICFYGPDGAGKSTIAKHVAKYLKKKYKVKVSWMRGTHTFASVIARILRKFYLFQGNDNPYYRIKIPRKMSSLWWFLEFISIIPVWLTRYVFYAIRGYIIIGERGLIDFIVWVEIVSNKTGFIYSIYSKILLSISKKYSINIFVKAKPQILYERRKDDYISGKLWRQVEIYERLSKVLGSSIIDTSNIGIEESVSKVLRIIKEKVICDEK